MEDDIPLEELPEWALPSWARSVTVEPPPVSSAGLVNPSARGLTGKQLVPKLDEGVKGAWDLLTTEPDWAKNLERPLHQTPNQNLISNSRQALLGSNVSPVTDIPDAPLPGQPMAEKVTAGATQAVGDLAESFKTPIGVASLGIGGLPKVAQKVVAAAFSAYMAKQTPEIARQMGEEFGKPADQRDPQKISRLAVGAGLNTAFTVAGALHAAGMGVDPKIQAISDALKKTTPDVPPNPSIPIVQNIERSPNASQVPSATSVPKPEVRPPVGEAPPLRQQGETLAPQQVAPLAASKPPEVTPAPVAVTPSVSDFDQYQALVSSLKGVESFAEAAPIQVQIEAIKNRNGGMIPKSASEQPTKSSQPLIATPPAVAPAAGETLNDFGKEYQSSVGLSPELRTPRQNYVVDYVKRFQDTAQQVEQARQSGSSEDVAAGERVLRGIAKSLKAMKENRFTYGSIGGGRPAVVAALKSGKPVNAEAADFWGMKLPEGYEKQGENYAKPDTAKTNIRDQAKQFTDLVKEHADNQRWAQAQTLEDLHTPHPAKSNLGTMGIKGAIAINKATKVALRNAAKDLGLDPDKIGSESYRAQHLGKLQEFVAKQPSALPRLRPGEKGTGDLLQSEAPFNLAGEAGVDPDRISHEQADAEATRQASEQFHAEHQQEFGQGPGGKTYTPSQKPGESPETYEGTALKNAVAKYERATRGYPEATPAELREMAKRWEEAQETLYQDPTAGRRLADELIADPTMGLTDEKCAILLHHKVDIQNALNNAAEKTWTGTPEEKAAAKVSYARESDHFRNLLDAIKQRGTHWGREGRWRQALAYEDYTFATQERLLRASKADGSPLTDAERDGLIAKIKELERNQVEIEKTQQSKIDAAVNDALSKIEKTTMPRISPHIVQIAERIGAKLHTQAEESRTYLKGKLFTLSPDVLYHLSRIGADAIYETGLDFAKWSAKMIGEFQGKIKPHLQEVFDASKKLVDGLADTETVKQPATVKAAVKKTVAKTPDEKITAIKTKIADHLKNKKENEVSIYVQKLARIFYENGVRGRNKIVDAVHGVLKEIDPDLTREDAVRAFSGYGKFSQLSKDQVTVALRGYKGELQQVEKLRDMAQGIPPHKTGIERRTPTDQEKKLIQAVNRAKVKFKVPITDPDTQLKSALDTRKTQLETQIKDYTERLANKEFEPLPRRDLILDKRATQLQEQRDRIKQQFTEARIANERANRSGFEKFTDTAVDWARAVKLMSPTVFPKLVVAGLTRIATNPVYRAAGLPLKLIPGFSAKAPAELNWSTRALAKNIAATLSSAPEAWKKLTTGQSNVDVLAGKMAKSREMSGIIGNAHGMIKEPVRQGAYARSIELRTEAAIKQGLDPHDPVVQTSIVNSSLADAFREIFMNENAVTKFLFRLPLSALRQSDMSGARLLANTMEFIMPIVNIPTNIAIHTARLNPVIGFGEAATRLAMAAKRGELSNRSEKLSPQDAESISRAFKAGMIGTVLAAYAWQHPEMFGGVYDEKGKKRDLKPGQVNLFGMKTPTWMGHAPEIQFLNQVAAARRVYDRYVAKGDKANAATELLAFSVMAPVKNLPFIDNLMRIFNTYQSGGQVAGQMTRDALMPTMGSMNAWYDSKNWLLQHGLIQGTPEPHRTPKTFAQEWEMAVPGMRQNVPAGK